MISLAELSATKGVITLEQCLEAIEAYEDEINKPNTDPTTEERIAAALEFQNLMSM